MREGVPILLSSLSSLPPSTLLPVLSPLSSVISLRLDILSLFILLSLSLVVSFFTSEPLHPPDRPRPLRPSNGQFFIF